MKKYLVICSMLFAANIHAQLIVSAGTNMVMVSGNTLNLYDLSLVNNGSLTVNNSHIKFSGIASGNTISGSSAVPNLYDFTIDNSNGFVMNSNYIIANNLTLTNGYLSINGNALTVNGSISGTGKLNGSSTSDLIIGGNAGSFSFNTSAATLRNFTLSTNASATLASNVSLSSIGTLTLNSNATLNINSGNLLIFKSDANGTARIAAIGSGALLKAGIVGYGEVQAERFIPAKRAFRFLSPILTTVHSNATKPNIVDNWQEGKPATAIANIGTHISGSVSGSNGFDATPTGNGSMLSFNVATQSWTEWNASSNNLANTKFQSFGQGYRVLIRGDRTIDLSQSNPTATNTVLRTTGKPLTGNLQLTNSTSPSLGANIGDYSLIGNPYLSPIDWNAIHANATSIEDYYWVWDPTRNVKGAYVYWDKSDGSNSGLGSAVNQYIQTGQAFFVRTNAINPALNFSENHKAANTTNTFRLNNTNQTKLSITLANNTLLAQNNAMDVANIYFDNSYSNAINDDDIIKLNNQDENLSININGKDIARKNHQIVIANDTISLRLWQVKNADYVFSIFAQNFLPITQAWLRDNYLNQSMPINLSSTTDVNFTVNANIAASIAENRFSIVFRNDGALPIAGINIKAYQQNSKQIKVDYTAINENEMDKYIVEESNNGQNFIEVSTQHAIANNGQNNNYNWIDNSINNGNNYYRIKAIGKDSKVQYSNIVNVKIGSIKNAISISPNPIKGKTMFVQLENLEKGNYTVTVINNLGQQVLATKIIHGGGSTVEQLILPASIAQAIYSVIIKGDNGIEQSIKVLVE